MGGWMEGRKEEGKEQSEYLCEKIQLETARAACYLCKDPHI